MVCIRRGGEYDDLRWFDCIKKETRQKTVTLYRKVGECHAQSYIITVTTLNSESEKHMRERERDYK